MATRRYIRGSLLSAEGINYHRWMWTEDLWDNFLTGGSWWFFGLMDSRGSGAFDNPSPTIDGPTDGAVLGVAVSYPVAADFTMSGTISLNFWGRETSSAANAGYCAAVMRYDPDGTATLVGQAADGVELGTGSNSLRTFTITPTSTDFTKGDRILVMIGMDDAGGDMVGGYNGILRTDGANSGQDGDTWVEFTENITFDESTPAGTTLFLTDTTSDITDQGAGNDEKMMWLTRGSSAVTAIINTVDGPMTPFRWTKTGGGNTLEWFSRPLNAFTLAGKVKVNLRGIQASPYNFFPCFFVEIARVDNNGANPVVWAKALISKTGLAGGPVALQSPQDFRSAHLSAPDLSFSEGQRLRLRVFAAEDRIASGGGGETAYMNAGTNTGTMYYNGPTLGASGDAYVILTQTVTASDEVAKAIQIPWEADGMHDVGNMFQIPWEADGFNAADRVEVARRGAR